MKSARMENRFRSACRVIFVPQAPHATMKFKLLLINDVSTNCEIANQLFTHYTNYNKSGWGWFERSKIFLKKNTPCADAAICISLCVCVSDPIVNEIFDNLPRFTSIVTQRGPGEPRSVSLTVH